ncbi:protein kinase [Conexibacter sp. W3-3-2]|uniref:serine/threonine-protein kinase n=1 Tax=Conexibacter sp. W3-3-2 TaxID=2675227 RepID=UPI0012B92A74|nr:serine/threonine-protein kinase [Conexibacter sp. W3-3-2]MTD44535.1 protein kinase [Conexibacter sp. W3-3-2]
MSALDRYDVLRELGRGGMAIVHLARQRDLGRLLALKELGGFSVGDPAVAERFLRESRVASSLSHPNIVAVYDYFDEDGTPFMAMELVEGGSLRPLVGTLSLPQTTGVLEALLSAIGLAGQQGIVHRDLKPENVLVSADGHVKVADFGIAKAGEAAQGGANLTSQGMTVGTPAYMSPEQAMASDDLTPASDLYAIGCIAFELLTGQTPFTDPSPMKLLLKHVQEEVPDVRSVDPMIPEPIAAWVAAMCAKDPDDRPADAAAAWSTFEDAVLEFVGPTWRRDARLEPASTIEIGELPPQTDTPLRPPTMGGAGTAPPPGATGFQTYHAPAALHEVLGETGERPSGTPTATPPPTPAAATPAPTPVPRPAVRTPAPVPAVTGGQIPAVTRTVTGVEEEGRGPLVPALLAGVVALAAGAGLALAAGGGSDLATAAGPGVTLQAPAGWETADPRAVAGLGPDAVALAPAGAGAGELVAVGRVQRTRADLLPDAMSPGAGGPARATLAAGDAVLHRGAKAGGATADVYALPTADGVVVVACTLADRAACAEVAGSVQVDGDVQELGPTEAGAQALGQALQRLSSAIENPQQDLAAARSRGAQATAARDLGRAYTSAAGDIGDTEVGALAAAPLRDLERALERTGSAWSAYGSAAQSGDAAAVEQARGRIAGARDAVKAARAALGRAGYGGKS